MQFIQHLHLDLLDLHEAPHFLVQQLVELFIDEADFHFRISAPATTTAPNTRRKQLSGYPRPR